MKKLTILLVLCLVNAFVFATDNYELAMQKNIAQVYTAQSSEDLQGAVNAFERIGAAEKTKWEPYYYATFGYIMLSTREQDGTKKDLYLDKAQEVLARASEINPAESEIAALEGFIAMIRVSVDPATRGQKYSGMAMQSFGKALGMNPENPRALALMARMQFGTAQFFNSSTEEACAMASKAVEKFDTFKSDNVLAPGWGKEMALAMVKQCQ